jgi:hypothetical protein
MFSNPANVPSPGPGMKWFGYVATTGIVSGIAGLIACLIPEQVVRRVWWPALIWVVPVLAMVVVGYMVLSEAD